jgi:hypothetical protein
MEKAIHWFRKPRHRKVMAAARTPMKPAQHASVPENDGKMESSIVLPLME